MTQNVDEILTAVCAWAAKMGREDAGELILWTLLFRSDEPRGEDSAESESFDRAILGAA